MVYYFTVYIQKYLSCKIFTIAMFLDLKRSKYCIVVPTSAINTSTRCASKNNINVITCCYL